MRPTETPPRTHPYPRTSGTPGTPNPRPEETIHHHVMCISTSELGKFVGNRVRVVRCDWVGRRKARGILQMGRGEGLVNAQARIARLETHRRGVDERRCGKCGPRR